MVEEYDKLDKKGTALNKFSMNHASVLEAGLSETSGIDDSLPPATIELLIAAFLGFDDDCATNEFSISSVSLTSIPDSVSVKDAYSLLALPQAEVIISLSSKLIEYALHVLLAFLTLRSVHVETPM
jgi:hypothetical protein